MDKKQYLMLLVISFLYFFLRLSFFETIEFGYDQPRLAYTVLDFIKNGSLLNSQYYSLPTSWGNLSWGPLLVLFNSIFLIITANPLYVSVLMTIFNLFSIVFVFLIGKEFFSKRIALLATLLLTVHPWWVVFSRMIYQPTPIPTFIAMSTFFLLKTMKNPKSWWLMPLVLSWALLLQSYLITISFIFLSLIILMYETKLKVNYKYLILSTLACFVLFLPSAKYYLDNPSMFYNFLYFKGKFVTLYGETFINFMKTLSGNNFEWQLGYAYKTFFEEYVYLKFFQSFNLIVVSAMLLFVFMVLWSSQNKYIFYLVILLMLPLIAIPLIGVEYVVPRYFLYVLPFLSLLLAVSIDYLFIKFGSWALVIPGITVAFWIIFIFKYFTFIKLYDYPNGFLSNWSDVPYSFLKNSFDWIKSDADIKQYDTYTISLDPENSYVFNFNYSQRYYWEYVLEKDEYLTGNVGHYLMYFTPSKTDDYQRFGPYVVHDVTSSRVTNQPN